MRKFFGSGGAFMVVALLSFGTGLIAENGATFVALGGFWLILAIVVRARNAKKPPTDGDRAN